VGRKQAAMSVFQRFRFPLFGKDVDLWERNHVIAIQLQGKLPHLTPDIGSQNCHKEHDASTHFRIPTLVLIAVEAPLLLQPRHSSRLIVGTAKSANSNCSAQGV
jgi:hypothetical protein